jgi:hypothetical protein
MFISKSQKIDFQARIEVLEMRVDQLFTTLNDLLHVQNMPPPVKAAKMKRSTEGWTPEARAIHGERIRLAWASKREAKVKA